MTEQKQHPGDAMAAAFVSEYQQSLEAELREARARLRSMCARATAWTDSAIKWRGRAQRRAFALIVSAGANLLALALVAAAWWPYISEIVR